MLLPPGAPLKAKETRQHDTNNNNNSNNNNNDDDNAINDT